MMMLKGCLLMKGGLLLSLLVVQGVHLRLSKLAKCGASLAGCMSFVMCPLDPCYGSLMRSGDIIYSEEEDFATTPTDQQQQSLKDQLKAVQALQLQEQVRVVKQAKRGKETESLEFNDVDTIVNGIATLRADGASAVEYPLGYPDATSVDEAFGGKQAYLYISIVGKNGPPVAAKRYRLNTVKFPFEFKVTTDDLLFPYSRETWLKSPLSKGPVACTAVIDRDGALVTASDVDRFGFAIADPVNMNDAFSRSLANVEINLKSDGKTYSKSDLEILSRVDSEIERLENR